MKFSLIIFLIAVCLPLSIGRTFEDDVVVKTVVKEEWETVDGRGRSRGRGRGRDDTDTIIIIDENDRDDDSDDQPARRSRPTANKQKKLNLNRYHKQNDFHFSSDDQEQNSLTQSGYAFDGFLGRVFARREDAPDCPDLMPITRMSHPVGGHSLVVTGDRVQYWIAAGWKVDRVIGYGVLEQGNCGATKRVRHLGKTTHFQTSNDAEYNEYVRNGYNEDKANDAPVFYIWKA